jgi:hypothetical protein
MTAFTKEQLQYLETVYGLVVVAETLPVRDGVVKKGDMVWWRGINGPEHVVAGDAGGHWYNIETYPHAYQITPPRTKVEYLDE